MFGVFLGPVLIALCGAAGRRVLRRARDGSSRWAPRRRWRTSARARVVPGANDNLSSVAVIVALAHALRERPAAGRARDPALHRLRGVVHGGHAGLRAAPLPRAAARDHRVRLPRVRGLAAAVRGGGGGDAAHAPLPRRRARGAGPGRRAPACRCAAGCRTVRRHRRADRRCGPATGSPRSAGWTRPSSRPTTTGRATCPTTSPGSRWSTRRPPARPTCAWRPRATRTEAPAARSAATPCARAGSPPACPPASRRSRKRPRRRSGRRT